MVQFDRTVPPGGEGKIELKVNTNDLSGTIKKEAKVYTNDPKNSIVTLTLKAYVKLFILTTYPMACFLLIYGRTCDLLLQKRG